MDENSAVSHKDVAMMTVLSELSKLEGGGYDDEYHLPGRSESGEQTRQAVQAVKKAVRILGGITRIADPDLRDRYLKMLRTFGAEDGD